MREDHTSKVRRIEEILKAAHRARDLPRLPASFSGGVMREIKELGQLGTERAENGWFSREDAASAIEAVTVWKFAAAAALLTIIVCGYFLGSDPSGVSCELAEFAAGDSSALILAHSLALI